MGTQSLPLSILCDVTSTPLTQSVSASLLNQAICIGNSGVIPSQGPNSRAVLMPNLAALTTAGFSATDPEYLYAQTYFSQNPTPQYLWVGCQDPTAIGTLALDPTFGGTGYAVGDVFLVTQSSASFGYGTVTAVSSGVVTAVSVISGRQGTGYTVGTGLSTVAQSPSVGTGLEVNITAIGETPLQAVTACRIAAPAWYACSVTTATDADHLAITEYAQTAAPLMQYIYATTSSNALTGAPGNIFTLLKTANYTRAHGSYFTTQGGAAPNNAYIAAALAGVASGRTTGLASSNFTLAGKTLVGIIPEALSEAQFNVFAGTPGLGFGNNGNVYLNFAQSYSFYEQGINSNGIPFMTQLGLDMLTVDAQISVLNVYAGNASIAQDDVGQSLITQAVRGACDRSLARGFLAPGTTWNGPQILSLSPGTVLPHGYMVQSPSFSTQSAGDKALLKGMPVYVAVIIAGSQQSFTISISTQ